MSKILFLTTTPTIGGNGDTLINTAIEEAKKNGAEIKLVNIREKQIGFCKACYGCATTGVCVQKDDFMELLKSTHEAEAIIAEAPIYYNCMAAQMMTVINRLCCTFACKTYQMIGPKKKIGIFLTCTGSEPEEMKRHVKNILTLPSISRTISEYKTEVFTQCISDTTCKDRVDYLEKQKKLHAGQCKYRNYGVKNGKTNCFYKLLYFKCVSYWMQQKNRTKRQQCKSNKTRY